MADKTVVEKIGIKAGERVRSVDPPRGFTELLGGLPEGAKATRSGRADLVLLFVVDQKGVREKLPEALGAVADGNRFWVCYPKKTSAIATDLSRDVGWAPLEAAGWEPVSLVAIDATWSALRWKRTGTIPARAAGRPPPGPLTVPDDLARALEVAPRAKACFEALPPSHRREHLRAIEDAKRPETRARRIEAAIKKLSEG